MTFAQLIRVICKIWYYIIGAIAVVAIVVFLSTFFTTKIEYSASAKFIANVDGVENPSQSTLDYCSEKIINVGLCVNTISFAEKVLENIKKEVPNTNITLDDIANSMSLITTKSKQVFIITSTHSSAQKAQLIAASAGVILQDYMSEVDNSKLVYTILELPEKSTVSSNRTTDALIYSAIGALSTGVLFIIVLFIIGEISFIRKNEKMLPIRDN